MCVKNDFPLYTIVYVLLKGGRSSWFLKNRHQGKLFRLIFIQNHWICKSYNEINVTFISLEKNSMEAKHYLRMVSQVV